LRAATSSLINAGDNKFDIKPSCDQCLQRSNSNLRSTDVHNALGALARQGRK
jgi:hypothetical protein